VRVDEAGEHDAADGVDLHGPGPDRYGAGQVRAAPDPHDLAVEGRERTGADDPERPVAEPRVDRDQLTRPGQDEVSG
jgi:hypothetical protein